MTIKAKQENMSRGVKGEMKVCEKKRRGRREGSKKLWNK